MVGSRFLEVDPVTRLVLRFIVRSTCFSGEPTGKQKNVRDEASTNGGGILGQLSYQAQPQGNSVLMVLGSVRGTEGVSSLVVENGLSRRALFKGGAV